MNPSQVFQLLQQIRQNPVQLLAQKGIDIPTDIAQNPQAIVQHLLNQGKINQAQVNQAMQMARNLKI